jgi:hypothetical protein
VLRRPTRQLKLAGARQSLDAGLFAKRSRAVGHRYDCCQLDRTAAPCVATCGAGAMGGQSPLNVGRPAAVKAVVGAPEQVDVGHAGSFAGGPWSPAARGFCFVREAVVARIVAELLRATGATVVGHLPVDVVPPEDHVDAERDERRATPAEGRSRMRIARLGWSKARSILPRACRLWCADAPSLSVTTATARPTRRSGRRPFLQTRNLQRLHPTRTRPPPGGSLHQRPPLRLAAPGPKRARTA